MADEDQPKEQAASGGGKKKLLIFAILGLVLVGVSVGGTLLALQFFGPKPKTADDASAEQQQQAAEPVKLPAIYFPLKPPIIVNFQARGRQRFLQAEVTLMAREDDVVQAIEIHMPMIRNSLVMMLGGQVFEEIQTAEGKELLRQQALEEIQNLLQQEIGKPGIEQVLFTNFVKQ